MSPSMTTPPLNTPMDFQQGVSLARTMRAEIAKVFVGQDALIEQTLTALFAGGHVLLEGVPGLGKTLLVKALARTLGGRFARIQFTPDLMPADITGHALFDSTANKFVIRRGPLFANMVLADEINRAPAKTQAALLEVMQEGQVTIEGESQLLAPPFLVLATQNPIEHERALTQQVTHQRVGDRLDVDAVTQVLQPAQVVALQKLTAALRVDEAVLDYAVRIARATREWPGIANGAGPRGGIALVRAARGYALLHGREFVTPDDIKAIAPAALRHRMLLAPEAEIEGLTVDALLTNLLAQVDAPRA